MKIGVPEVQPSDTAYRNAKNAPLLSADASRGNARVIRTGEESVIARSFVRALRPGSIRGTYDAVNV